MIDPNDQVPVPPESARRPGDAPHPASRDEDILALAHDSDIGLLRELWQFLSETKKWWLTPIVVALLIIGALIVFGASAAGPFVYTLF